MPLRQPLRLRPLVPRLPRRLPPRRADALIYLDPEPPPLPAGPGAAPGGGIYSFLLGFCALVERKPLEEGCHEEVDSHARRTNSRKSCGSPRLFPHPLLKELARSPPVHSNTTRTPGSGHFPNPLPLLAPRHLEPWQDSAKFRGRSGPLGPIPDEASASLPDSGPVIRIQGG